jgi:tetratricopeptide (TPR) repeat protein
VWQADALNVFGWNQALVGDYPQALILCEQALALYQELNISYGKAATWDSLGYVHHHLGHHHKAIACYRRSLKLFRDLGDRYYEANTLSHLGDTYHAAGAVEAACDAYEQALSILNDLDHPDAGQVLSRLAATNQPAIPAPAPANHAAGQA